MRPPIVRMTDVAVVGMSLWRWVGFREIRAMYFTENRANEVSGAVWLIGIGILLYTRYWWPGILFVIGAGSIAWGLAAGRGWYAFQGAVWTIGLGLVFALGMHVGTILILVGISALVGALVKPPFVGKPYVDNRLD